MNQMGVRMVEKVCRREEKRLRMMAFEGGCCHVGNGVLTAVFATRPEKIISCPGRKNSLGSMTNVTNDSVIS